MYQRLDFSGEPLMFYGFTHTSMIHPSNNRLPPSPTSYMYTSPQRSPTFIAVLSPPPRVLPGVQALPELKKGLVEEGGVAEAPIGGWVGKEGPGGEEP